MNTKIKLLRKENFYCRFHNICECFKESSITCVNGGGNYCGKFRELYKEMKIEEGCDNKKCRKK